MLLPSNTNPDSHSNWYRKWGQGKFYTANLLSFHRWMAILPVLIVAFYLLYLLKTNRIEGRAVLQGIAAVLVMACILFAGWSWTENHVLSLNRAAWSTQYASRAMVYHDPAILPRLGFWIVAAFPTASLLLAWQLHAGASGVAEEAAKGAVRPLAWLALLSGIIAAVSSRAVFRGALPAPGDPAGESGVSVSIAVAGLGVILQASAWLPACIGKNLGKASLSIASIAAVMFWIGTLTGREAARLSVLATAGLFARHEQVGTIAGLVVFLLFAGVGLGTIAWIVRTVSDARARPPSQT